MKKIFIATGFALAVSALAVSVPVNAASQTCQRGDKIVNWNCPSAPATMAKPAPAAPAVIQPVAARPDAGRCQVGSASYNFVCHKG